MMKFPVLKLYIDIKGRVVKATDMLDRELEDSDYCSDEQKRIDVHGVLASENWCCWQLVNGVWKCGPC
jgi:hypothetical protein